MEGVLLMVLGASLATNVCLAVALRWVWRMRQGRLAKPVL